MKTFCVIIPTFNRKDTLRKAINSVLNQTFQDFEIIVVNDHNIEIDLSDYDDPRITLINSCCRKGPANARNIGVMKSRSKYISFLDDDDFYSNRFLEYSLFNLENSDDSIGMCWCAANFVKDGAIVSTYNPSIDNFNIQHIIEAFLSVGTGFGVTFKSKVLKSIGAFNNFYRYIEDTDLFVRSLSNGFYPKFIPFKLININQHSSARQTDSSNYDTRITECYKLIDSNTIFFDQNPRLKNQIMLTVSDLSEKAKINQN